MEIKTPPLCPEQPHKQHEVRPHKEKPSRPRPQAAALGFEPRFAPGTRLSTTTDDYDVLRSIIDRHKRQRREAIDTIKNFRASSVAMSPAIVAVARDYLEHWRERLRDDITEALPYIDPKYLDLKPRPADPNAFKTRSSPTTFDQAVSQFRTANAAQIRATPTAELRRKYEAARVIRHAPDILAIMPLLDNDDAARTMIAVKGAYNILEKDLTAQDNVTLIENLMDHPRLPDPTYSPAVMAEMDAIHEGDPPGTPHPAFTPDDIFTNRDWMEHTAARINSHIGNFLRDHRWDVFGSFMGSLTTALDETIMPQLLGDANAVGEKLTAQTVVTISLLKTGLVPNHTDDEEGVKLWWETLELYAEENDIGEIPPAIIIAAANELGIEMLEHSPQPEGEMTPG